MQAIGGTAADMRPGFRQIVILLAVTWAAVSGNGIAAQEVAPQVVPSAVSTASDPTQQVSSVAPRFCSVVSGPPERSGARELRAQCWGTGLILGSADRFAVSVNLALAATMVTLWHNDRESVLLLHARADGTPIVEDISGLLAVTAGRAPWKGIKGLTLDSSNFSSLGSMEIVAPAPADAAQRQSASARTSVDLRKHIAVQSTTQPITDQVR